MLILIIYSLCKSQGQYARQSMSKIKVQLHTHNNDKNICKCMYIDQQFFYRENYTIPFKKTYITLK